MSNTDNLIDDGNLDPKYQYKNLKLKYDKVFKNFEEITKYHTELKILNDYNKKKSKAELSGKYVKMDD